MRKIGKRHSPRRLTALAAILPAFVLRAQQATPLAAPATTVVVIGNPEPVTQGESNRSTVVLDTERHPLVFSDVEDYLRTDASTYVGQRGAGGSQADLSLRGGSPAQTLVLLNGIRINDAETPHNNMDLPVPLCALAGVDLLHGAGSTLYGSDAISGVADFLTAVPLVSSLRVRSAGGNYGTNEQALLGALAGTRWSEVVAAERHASAGFTADRDYRDVEASSESRWKSRPGLTDVLLAADDRAFGADQFYGNYPSYERTKGWFASLSQSLGERTQAAFGYRRHTDEYLLFRSQPLRYENNHIDTSWQGSVRRGDVLGRHVKLFYGAEADADTIQSTNLGVHARQWGSFYADAEMHWERLSLDVGARQEFLSEGFRVTSPMLSAGYKLSPTLRLRGQAGYGFRLPTYLDLYYNDPGTVGNASLRPESAWNFEVGADWAPTAHVYFFSTGFYSRQHNTIDYLRPDAASKYFASNLSTLRFAGWENAAAWQPRSSMELKLSWTLLAGAQNALAGFQSRYVFNYPVDNASLEATYTHRRGYLVHTRVGVTQRYRQSAYAVWDAAFAREAGRWRPYLRLTNVVNTGYQEVTNVQMPGRQVLVGIELNLHREPRAGTR